MEKGTLITWEYTHHLNSRSTTQRLKQGWFVREIKHNKGYKGKQKVIVKFYDNKGFSRIPLSEIKEMSIRRKNLIAAQKDICDTF